MQITKIEQQKKNPQRYSLYIDGSFSLGIDERVLVNLGLYKGQRLDQNLINQIRQEEGESKLYNKTLNYISYRMRSLKEVRDYLDKQSKEMDLTEEKKEEIVRSLQKAGYINDDQFAVAYMNDAAGLNHKGPRLIHQELIRKGLEEASIQGALETYLQSDQEENAGKLLKKFLRTKSNLPVKQAKRKAYQHLYQKGYESDLINRLINQASFETQADQEESLLDRQGQKIYQKRQLKYSGYQLKQKLFEGLAGKGFNFEAIQSWLEDHQDWFEEEE